MLHFTAHSNLAINAPTIWLHQQTTLKNLSSNSLKAQQSQILEKREKHVVNVTSGKNEYGWMAYEHIFYKVYSTVSTCKKISSLRLEMLCK